MLTGKPIGKILSGRPRSRWEDNVRMDIQEKQGIRLRIAMKGEP